MSEETCLNLLPTVGEMEALFVNNPSMMQLEAYLNRFNPIKTMRMERMEIRHSAVLAWLLDPSETHGLADHFLKAFLGEALRGYSALGQPTALDISRADMRDAEIRREWQNIDIFIISQTNDWAFVIENKFDSKQREGQLESYIKAVRSSLKKQSEALIIRGIFLTLQDEEPEDQCYAPVKYEAVCTILSRLLELEGLTLSVEVATFLKHYLEVIRDATGMSEDRNEMEKLARELYRDHRKVLDFVMQNGAGSDFAIAARSLVGETTQPLGAFLAANQNFVFGGLTNTSLNFMPSIWVDLLTSDNRIWEGCESWWMRFPLIAWFQLWSLADGKKGQLRLNAELGPLVDHKMRVHFIDEIEAIAKSKSVTQVAFNKGARDKGKQFSRFLKRSSVTVDDVQNADEISEKMEKLLKNFKDGFDVVTEALPSILSSKLSDNE